MNLIEPIYNYLEGQRKAYVPSGNYASQVGNPCKRSLVYQRLAWQDKAIPSRRSIMIFKDGDLHEDAIIRLLQDTGFKVTQQQAPFEIKPINVRGKIDAMVEGVPVEIKSMNTYTFQKINSYEDMIKSDKAYIRGYIAQMMTYLLGMNKEKGIFILRDKNTSELKQIDVTLDLDYAEDVWKKMEEVERYVKAEEYPDRITDRDVCKFCDFKAVCLPNEAWDQAELVSDEALCETLENYDALKKYASGYKKADEIIKKFVESHEAGEYIIDGKYAIQISEYQRTIYEIPSEIKSEYAQKVPTKRKKVVNLVVNLNENDTED